MKRANILTIVWTNLIVITLIASTKAIDNPDIEIKTSDKNISDSVQLDYQKAISHENRGEFVTEHNAVRSSTENAVDMVYMVWSLRLEKMAEKMTADCIYKDKLNNKDYTELTFFFSSGGLNAWDGNASESLNVSEVVQAWHEEKNYFHYDSLGCELGRKCMRYAQIVWATASHVGCSLSFCLQFIDQTRNNQPNRYSVICIYGEGETKMTRQGDYRSPYKIGNNSCEACPTGFSECRRGLCDTDPFCETVVDCPKVSNEDNCLCEESVYKSRSHRSIVLPWISMEAVIALVIFMSSYDYSVHDSPNDDHMLP